MTRYVKMLSTQLGAENGISVSTFEEGETYEIHDKDLVEIFLKEGWAEEVDAPETQEEGAAEKTEEAADPKKKNKGEAPENRAKNGGGKGKKAEKAEEAAA